MKIHTVQLNLADFDKGTSGLSPIEFTIYTRLFLAAYERNLPDDDEVLARIARVAKKDIKKARPLLEEKFKKVNGFLQNSRTELERERYKKLSEINRQKANGRWKIGDSPMPLALPQQSQNDTNGSAAAILTNNHHLPTNNHKEIKSPSPIISSARGEGDFKAIGEMVGGRRRVWRVIDIIGQLQGSDLEEVRKVSKGFDVEFLAKVYVDGINAGREAPRSIPKAFPKWCEKYVNGKQS